MRELKHTNAAHAAALHRVKTIGDGAGRALPRRLPRPEAEPDTEQAACEDHSQDRAAEGHAKRVLGLFVMSSQRNPCPLWIIDGWGVFPHGFSVRQSLAGDGGLSVLCGFRALIQ